MLSIHQYVEYIALMVESMCFENLVKNLVKIVPLISFLIQAKNKRKRNQICLLSILLSTTERERERNCSLSSLYLTAISFHSIKQKWINITLNTSNSHHRITNLYTYIYAIVHVTYSGVFVNKIRLKV